MSAFAVLLGNRFNHWGNAIIQDLLKHKSNGTIWAPFSGTEAGYLFAKDLLRHQPSVRVEWDKELLLDQYKKVSVHDASSDFKELVKKLRPGAMNRIIQADRFFGQAYVRGVHIEDSPIRKDAHDSDELIKYLVTLLRWVWTSLETRRPKSIFCYCVAGSLAMAMWEVSQAMGIPFRTLDFSRIDGLHHIGTSPFHDFSKISRIFESLEPTESEITWGNEILSSYRVSPVNNSDWNRLAGKLHELTVSKISKQFVKNIIRWKRWRANVSYFGGPFTRIWTDFECKWRARGQLGGDILDYSQLPDKFIYFPLHVDPEASTMVQSPFVQNQMMVIENLARSLPLDWSIVVKEHLISLGWRKDSFYREIREFPNVRIISPRLDGPRIIQRASAVATITGTSGWQAMILGRPVICYGRPFYHALKGGYLKINGWGDLSEKWDSFYGGFNPVSDSDLIRFLAAIKRGSFLLDSSAYWETSTPEESYLKYPHVIEKISEELIDPN